MVTGLLGLFIFCVASPQTVSASELYFDNEGNLYFHTRDKKATGGTKYKTIGWVIKRYDMPMNASGQQYVIVTKSTYKPDEVDPSDNRYVFCYFKSDKEEILEAVKSVSTDWYEQLYYYGDEVYIDSVMTIVQSGVQLGTLNKGGTYSGEVYFTYEGIAGARKWSSPQSLKSRFDMSVEVPILHKTAKPMIVINSIESMELSNNNMLSFILGHDVYGQEKYDVHHGIPSGDTLYLKGVAMKGLYNITLQYIQGVYRMMRGVPVEYTLEWVDYEGNQRREKKMVYVEQEINSPFAYYQVEEVENYCLKELVLKGDIWDENVVIETGISRASIDVKNIVNLEFKSVEVSVVNGGTLKETKRGIKPSIPHIESTDLADYVEMKIQVCNDGLSINGDVILSTECVEAYAPKPTNIGSWGIYSIYEEGIEIPTEIANGIYDGMEIELVYENRRGQQLTYVYAGLPEVVVHTPVVCNGYIESNAYVDNDSEERICISLGREFRLVFGAIGIHKDIPGYGYGNYLPYVDKRRVRCTFPVEYMGVQYAAGDWIEVLGNVAELWVCEDVVLGEHKIELQAWAYNGIAYEEAYVEENANLAMDNYGASCSLLVQVVGWKADMQVSGTH